MKKLIKLPAIVLGLMLLLTGFTQRVMAQDDDVSLQSFYDELSPYGTWIQDPQYGYVWRPDVDQQDFRPYYSNGRWAMTEYGNTWVSDYDWGWAPFHYGRWVYNRYRQWLWIPDTVWGPAWVSWRSGGGYYGWAPLSPGLNININIGIPDNWWVFIPQANIYYDRFPRYYSRRNVTIIHNTTIINNTYERGRRTYYTGPRIDDVRRATRGDVTVYRVNRTDRSGRSEIRGNELNIYNPRPSRESRGTVQAPRNAIQGDANYTRGDRNTVNAGRPSRSEGINGGRTPGADRTDRGNRDNVNPSPNNRPSRNDAGNLGNGNTVGRPENRPSRENNSPATLPGRNPEVNPSQTDRTYPGRENRPSRMPNSSPNVPQQQQPVPQQQPQVRPQREQRPQQMPQQQQQNPQPSQRAERQERQMPQQQQQPQRQQEPQRQAEPQRQPQAQPQRESRQSAPPRSEGRSSEGRTEGARSSRGGRG
ncbi:hypothetical protein QG516_14240 [Pedobacter gandavensis]|uniref:DUF6600 domain-containing protein n=1 Tax=Pedobacter gandavensis TaxID=2679963 RepID=UPI0024785631|nr:DUF6600 domain-containing protein [Pedobacter gandavensis]WGQ07722.1 hypothetical protein QG516_14240 [Pedobacter gandavensis]